MTEPSARVRAVLEALDPAGRLHLLHQRVPALAQADLAAFHTGNEALHGVAWLGRATVFCQAVGLGATWDAALVRRVGEAVGTEARAMHNGDPEVGLNVWAPVVDPLRHPAWGRNEEGYSEDPHLTAELATAYAAGMKGDHPRWWRVTPTLKHLCAYNVEDHRDAVSVQVPPRVLHEYELPAFLGPLRAGVVAAVMPSYNLVNGRAAHLSADLLDAVRAACPHPLAVVSDAYAPGNVFRVQRPELDEAEAFALVVRAGVDSVTEDDARPGPTLRRLGEALDRGLLEQADVDRAAARVLSLRELTGELDEEDPWADLGAEQVASAEHAALAREAATAAVVVLNAPGGTLPLDPAARTGVVGPLADEVLTDWYSGSLPYRVSVADAVAELGPQNPPSVSGDDTVLLRVAGSKPARWLGTDPRSAVRAVPRAAATSWQLRDWGHGVLTFRAPSGLLGSPDGRALHASAQRVGGWEVQESFRAEPHPDGTVSLLHTGTGRWVHLRPDGVAEVGARTAQTAARFEVVVLRSGLDEAARLAEQVDTVVVALGNDPHLNGRETADRPDLRLPPRQVELVRTLRAGGAHVVVVVVSSYPYVLDDDVAELPLLWSSHGGQELGHAVVDVLTGAAEPRGRLPQPWPRRAEDAGDRFDYDLVTARQTSWWSPHAPRFPLGHGLHWSATSWAAPGVEVGPDGLRVPVRVETTGGRPAPEVVQVYGRALGTEAAPRRLLGHVRVDVAPGGSAEVTVEVPWERLELWDVTSDGWWRPARHRVEVARSATDVVAAFEVEVPGRPQGLHRPSVRPVRAECFSSWSGLELVGTGDLRGHALRASGAGSGTVRYDRLDLTGARALVLCLRPGSPLVPGPASVRARLVDAHGEERVAAATAEPGELVLAVDGGAGPYELVVELAGPLELVELAAR
ncbi:glycoside hydrolase family 3 C-terminal domain-containing protein [Auraticoccus cholistanensis]|uniref:glycoside hydrolase family 3 C-terminal domain-containing protein n=1 Tax=Auraticoccus cholistanensis TaxID=2656650 RepID=UPI0018D24BE3